MLQLKVKRDFSALQKEICVNDLVVLENYLNESVKLRLINSGNDEKKFKEANEISKIITRLIGILNQKCEGKIPVIEIIETRKCLAKFIGLSFFKLGRECLMKFGPNCAITGPCCSLHRLEGLKESHDLFPKLFEPFGVKFERIDAVSDTFFTSLLAVYADFKTQIIVTEMILFLSNELEMSGQETSVSFRLENLLETYFGSAMHLAYLKGKLQDRAVQIRGILERGGSKKNLIESLRSKYPVDLFESNLKNILKNVYGAFPETFLNELTSGKSKLTGKEPLSVKKQEPASVKKQESASVKLQEPVPVKVKLQDPVESMSIKEKGQALPTVQTTDENTIANTVNTKQAVVKPLSARLDEESEAFKDVIISGRFFRGILEPVDERFAAIIEASDISVRQYLELRKKGLSPKKMSANNKKVTAQTVKSSLMERHNSAEKIAWETQEQIVSPICEAESCSDSIFTAAESNDMDMDDGHETFENVNKFQKKMVKRTSEAPRGRRRFSEQEVMNLIEGIRRFGRDWRKILNSFDFQDRNNVDLKDKARNLDKLGLL